MSRRAVIYTRVSDPSQIDNYSLETQSKACQQFAKNNEYEVVKEFSDEGKSAKHVYTRKQLTKLIEFCMDKKNEIDAVIVYKIDRFTRETYEGLETIAILSKRNIKLLSATEHLEDTPIGRAIRTILMSVAQLDNETKGVRVRDNMQAMFRKGLWPFKLPIGYRRPYRTKEENKGLPGIADPNLAPIVKQLFKDAATGIYSKAQLARMMNSAGFTDHYRAKATHKIVDQILRKSFYYGNMYAKKWDEYVTGQHEPLIDRETWETAYNKVILKKKNYHYQDEEQYPLKGYIRCYTCGHPLTTSPSKGRNKHYYYYECRNKQCDDRVRIISDDAHEQFEERVANIKPNERVLKLFNTMVFDEWDKVIDNRRKTADKLERRIVELRKEQDSVRKAKDDGLYTLEEAKDRVEDIRTKISVLEIEKADIRYEEYDTEIVKEFTNQFLFSLDELWKNLSYPKKQAFVQMVFDDGVRCTTNREIRITKLSGPFALIKTLDKQKGENVTLVTRGLNRC